MGIRDHEFHDDDIESVFVWPGVGSGAIESIELRLKEGTRGINLRKEDVIAMARYFGVLKCGIE